MTPIPNGYEPNLTTTSKIVVDSTSLYQSQIDVLRWCVDIVSIDMITEVSVLFSQLTLPCEVHLKALFHLFSYLDKKVT